MTAADRAVVVWFRRDLRLADHPALLAAVEFGIQPINHFLFPNWGYSIMSSTGIFPRATNPEYSSKMENQP